MWSRQVDERAMNHGLAAIVNYLFQLWVKYINFDMIYSYTNKYIDIFVNTLSTRQEKIMFYFSNHLGNQINVCIYFLSSSGQTKNDLFELGYIFRAMH